MVKKVGIPQKKKVINLTKEMQKKYDGYIRDFKEVVMFKCSAETKYLASFNFGILKTARGHLIEGANIILFRAIGLNKAGTDVEISAGLEMTILELMGLRKAIDDTIRGYEIKVGRKLSTLQEEGNKQKAQADKVAYFKIEK